MAKVYVGKVFSVKQEDVLLPNGRVARVDVVKHPGAVVILAIRNGKLVMVEQYRPAIGEWLLELPAGTLKHGEDPLSCAKRELEEETGFVALEMEKLFDMYVAPGYSTERMYVYLAKELRRTRTKFDVDEVIKLREVALEEALEMVRDGRIRDAKSISALLYVKCFHLEGAR